MTGTWTHKDLAKRLGVSVTTIKSYRVRFPGALVPTGRGKPLRFGPEAVAVCRAIRKGFQAGLSIDEIQLTLIKEFPDIDIKRHLSISDDVARAGTAEMPTPEPATAPWPGLAEDTSRRLGRLETMLAELVALGNRTHSLHVELLAKLDALAGLPGLARAAADRSASGSSPAGSGTPPRDFLDQPVVVLSDRGEYLGITGQDGAAFSLREFEAHLVRRAGRMDAGSAFHAAWTPRREEWVLNLRGAPRRPSAPGAEAEAGHEHFFRRTTTKKGNLVALFHRLRVNGKDVSEAFLRAFFKQIKDSLE